MAMDTIITDLGGITALGGDLVIITTGGTAIGTLTTGTLLTIDTIITDLIIIIDTIITITTEHVEELTTTEAIEPLQLLEEAIQLDAEGLLYQDAHLMFIEEAVTEPIEALETRALQEIQEDTIQEPIDLTTEI